MAANKELLKAYSKGQKYCKSSDGSSCPICEAARKPESELLSRVQRLAGSHFARRTAESAVYAVFY